MSATHRRSLLAGAGFAIIGTASGTKAQAQARTVLRLGWTTSDGAQDPYAIGARAFKEEAERRSNGRLDVQLFPNRALGDERPLLDGMRLGTVDMGIITNAVIAQIEPAFQINDMPFLFANEAQAQRGLDGAMGRSLAQRLESRGVLALGYMEGGFRQMINNVRPIVNPADVRGVKFRVLQSPIYIGLFNALGGTAVPMAWGETFTAVQQGAVDGLEIPLAVIEASRYNEVTKYLSLTNHIYSMIGLLMSKRSFDRLPADLKGPVQEAAAEATALQRKLSAEADDKLLVDLKAKGVQINTVDKTPFAKATANVDDKWLATPIGPFLKKVIAAAR